MPRVLTGRSSSSRIERKAPLPPLLSPLPAETQGGFEALLSSFPADCLICSVASILSILLIPLPDGLAKCLSGSSWPVRQSASRRRSLTGHTPKACGGDQCPHCSLRPRTGRGVYLWLPGPFHVTTLGNRGGRGGGGGEEGSLVRIIQRALSASCERAFCQVTLQSSAGVIRRCARLATVLCAVFITRHEGVTPRSVPLACHVWSLGQLHGAPRTISTRPVAPNSGAEGRKLSHRQGARSRGGGE